MVKKRQSFGSKLKESVMSIDRYGQGVNLTINGHENYPSVLGVIFTLIAAMIVMSYGINKTVALMHYHETNFMNTVQNEAVDPTDKFGWDQTHLNLILFLRRGKEYVNLNSLEGYITVKAYDYNFDVYRDIFLLEEIPSGHCNYDEI